MAGLGEGTASGRRNVVAALELRLFSIGEEGKNAQRRLGRVGASSHDFRLSMAKNRDSGPIMRLVAKRIQRAEVPGIRGAAKHPATNGRGFEGDPLWKRSNARWVEHSGDWCCSSFGACLAGRYLPRCCSAAIGLAIPRIWVLSIEQQIWDWSWIAGGFGVGLVIAAIWTYVIRRTRPRCGD